MQAFHDGSSSSNPRTENVINNGDLVLDPFYNGLPLDGFSFRDHHERRFDDMMPDPLMYGDLRLPPPPPPAAATSEALLQFSNSNQHPGASAGTFKSSPSSSTTIVGSPSPTSKAEGKTITTTQQQKQQKQRQQQEAKKKKVAKKTVTKKKNLKMKKAPGAPRRFKSAYMFFSTKKHKEFREELNKKGQKKINTTEVAKLVSKAWKSLSAEERKEWDDVALADKERYEVERAAYKGPWKIPAISTPSAGKDPTAPKRPMSAFLAFSYDNRTAVRSAHTEMSNAEITRTLSQMWKELPTEDRRIYQEKEVQMRNKYKVVLEAWKKKQHAKIMAKPKTKRKKKQNGPPAKKSNGKKKSVLKAGDARSCVVGRGKKKSGSAAEKKMVTVNKTGTEKSKTTKDGSPLPHDSESPPSEFETKMAEETFGQVFKIPQSFRLEENHNHLFPIESPTSFRTGDESDPSHQGWRDWQYPDSRQDISSGDRMTIAPTESPSYFPNNSMKTADETGVRFYYLDDSNSHRFSFGREGHIVSSSVPATPTEYMPHYKSNVDVSYSPSQTVSYGLKPNVLTHGEHYQYHPASSTQGWYHSSDRHVTAQHHCGGFVKNGIAPIRTHYETREYHGYYSGQRM